MKQSLKDALLSSVLGEKTPKADESNDALEDFKTMKDSTPEIEKYDFDKEYKKMIDSLNPHNYDSYEDYLKQRKKLDKESDVQVINELLDEAMGGKA